MQTLYACACDIKSNVGFFPLIIIILILSSLLLRVVVLVVVVLGPQKKKSSSGLSQKKNEKERFLDMKKTRFDVRGHTRKKKKTEDVASSPSPFSRRFFTFSLSGKERETQKGERRRGGLASPPKKVQTIHKNKIQSPLSNPRATERRRRHFGGQKTTGEKREKRRRRCGVARRTTEPRGPCSSC